MLGGAWLTLRQAQEALKNGRLDEAHRLLGQSGAQGHKRCYDLLQQLAQAFVERGERHLRHNDPDAAWADLLHAEQVAGSDGVAARLRQTLTGLALAEVRAKLEAGQPARAAEAAALLRERCVRQPELQTLEEMAKDWMSAQEVADRGEMSQAVAAVQRLRRHWPALPALEQLEQDLGQRRDKLAAILPQLHEAIADGHWRNVLRLADEVLALAPHHGEARKARLRAWQAIEPSTVGDRAARPEAETPPRPVEVPNRFLLWIDGVGGYLVCLAPKVNIGQATPDTTVDIPLFADVSRLHATITRDAEGYLLEAVRPVAINGKAADRALLQSGDRITLGASCQLQFRQPVPISTSARLDLASGHRLAQAVDAVLLMADTLVLGPSEQAHVNLPDVRQPVVLFRQKDGLGVRHAGPFTVDGKKCTERATLGAQATVSGEEFTLAIEPVGTRMGRT